MDDASDVTVGVLILSDRNFHNRRVSRTDLATEFRPERPTGVHVLLSGSISLHTSKETKAILNAVDDLGHGTEWLRVENTAIDIRDGQVTLEPDVDVVSTGCCSRRTSTPPRDSASQPPSNGWNRCSTRRVRR
jgi:hypothetical protein